MFTTQMPISNGMIKYRYKLVCKVIYYIRRSLSVLGVPSAPAPESESETTWPKLLSLSKSKCAVNHITSSIHQMRRKLRINIQNIMKLLSKDN